jgi:hypothetical protein
MEESLLPAPKKAVRVPISPCADMKVAAIANGNANSALRRGTGGSRTSSTPNATTIAMIPERDTDAPTPRRMSAVGAQRFIGLLCVSYIPR